MIFLRVPATLAYRDLVTRAVSAACKVALGKKASRSGDPFVHAMVSAVGEAFNNVVLHAYRDSAGEVEVAIDIAEGVMQVEVRDNGRSFDLEAVPVPDLDELPESGLGLYIIRALVDEVSYRRGTPNVLTIKKRLEPAA